MEGGVGLGNVISVDPRNDVLDRLADGRADDVEVVRNGAGHRADAVIGKEEYVLVDEGHRASGHAAGLVVEKPDRPSRRRGGRWIGCDQIDAVWLEDQNLVIKERLDRHNVLAVVPANNDGVGRLPDFAVKDVGGVKRVAIGA